MAVGWTLSRPEPSTSALARQAAIFAAVGMAPDLDLLVGRHSRETHSIGAALIVAAIAAWRRVPAARTRPAVFVAVAAAWFSHPLFDALSFDIGPPVGVMMWWPFSTDHWHTGVTIFDAIERHWEEPHFLRQNVFAVARELVMLVPTVLAVWAVRRRRR
jgi:membrane-bound metal-dependent hydrolase YbcI (DUF457 family)